MTPESRWEVARELFDAARELPVERREVFLAEHCADETLRQEVRELLAAHDALQSGSGGDFLQSLDAARSSALLASTAQDRAAGADELAPGAAVGRYSIVRRLGAGGMGVVYLAHDRRLDRQVALKLLPRDHSFDGSARARFQEEARAASALDHPHIATIYEIGEAADGREFIAMAFCDGATLRDRLEEGPLPVQEALTVAKQIAAALAAAHRRGIVHRDVKPGNVILTEHGVKLVDFGVAKMVGSGLTRAGTLLGTVAYMSPEQTRGEAADPATDVWSLGVTLYEMLTGTRPFAAGSEQAVVFSIRNDPAVPVGDLRPEVPEALGRVVERCLAKDPARRYPDAGALLADLDGGGSGRESRRPRAHLPAVAYATAAVVAVLLLAGGWFLWQDLRDSPPDRSTTASDAGWAAERLAVLPLANLSLDPADAYLAEGLTGELISRLSELPGLRVIARSSVMRYRDGERSLGEVGRDLNVRTVLEGGVRKTADRVLIRVRLVDATNGEQIWRDEYEGELSDVPELQRQIAAGVADHLDVRARRPALPARRGTEHAGAYKAYLEGRYFLGKLDQVSFQRSREHFQRALDLDPTFAHAWSGLAEAYEHLTSVSAMHAEEAYPRARAAAERALELDPNLASAHAALATALTMYYWESEAAERHFHRAIELDPSHARARRMYASHLRNLGRFDDALAEVRKAQELDPLSAFPRLEEGIILYVARRYDEAIEHSRRLLQTDPEARHAYFLLALAYAQKEQYEEAIATADRGDPAGTQPDANAVRGYAHARSGNRREALRLLESMQRPAREQPVSAFHEVAIYIGLGQHDRALDVLERAAAERTGLIRLLKVEPIFDPLRSHARFQALLTRVGLPS